MGLHLACPCLQKRQGSFQLGNVLKVRLLKHSFHLGLFNLIREFAQRSRLLRSGGRSCAWVLAVHVFHQLFRLSPRVLDDSPRFGCARGLASFPPQTSICFFELVLPKSASLYRGARHVHDALDLAGGRDD